MRLEKRVEDGREVAKVGRIMKRTILGGSKGVFYFG